MVNKPLFAQIINRRLTELDKSAAWLARQVGVSEAAISRWRDEMDTSRIQDNQHIHLLAQHLKLSDAERREFFAAAGLVWEPPAPATPALPLSHAEKVYLRTLRDECDRLPLVEDERASSLDEPGRTELRPSLANVYIDLQTESPPTFDQICDRLLVPIARRQEVRQALQRLDASAAGRGDADAYVLDLGDVEARASKILPRESATVDVKTLRQTVFKAWAKDGDQLKQALQQPQTTLEALMGRQRFVLLGDPGSGKTTYVSRLAHTFAGAWLDQDAGWRETFEGRFEMPLFPLRIVARRWSGRLSRGCEAGVERVYDELHHLLKDNDRKMLLARLEQPDTFVLFDGLDEAPVASERETFDRRRVLIASVQAFAISHPHCHIIVTSRIRPYQLPGYQLDGWHVFKLARLNEPRIQRFIKLWAGELARVEALGMPEAEHFAQKLSAAIRQRRDLREMAEIPLLLTMIAVVSRRYGLPENRAELYAQCTQQLLWKWEKVKAEEGKLQSLDYVLEQIQPSRTRQDIEKVLWRVTFEAHRRSGKSDADILASDLLDALAATTPIRDENHAWASQMIRFMQARGGLLNPVDDRTFSFPHRSFQEYLAARHLVENGKAMEEAIRLAADDAWRDVILLACGHLVVARQDRDWHCLVQELAFAIEDDVKLWPAAVMAGVALLEFGLDRVTGHIGRELQQELPPILTLLMQDPSLPPARRLEAGLLAADLGDQPADLDAFIPIPAGSVPYTYRIGKYPVTNSQYQRFMKGGGYELTRPWWRRNPVAVEDIMAFQKSHANGKWPEAPRYWNTLQLSRSTQPVVGVSWYEAMAYCGWLTAQLQQGYLELRNDSLQATNFNPQLPASSEHLIVRLLTKAEWEAAAGTDAREYAWEGPFSTSHCNSKESGFNQPSPVHMYPSGATSAGVFDLCGNVWEWNIEGDSEKWPWLRGGAWYEDADKVKTASWHGYVPKGWRGDFGFRVVIVDKQ